MVDAAVTQYREEFIHGFEVLESHYRGTVTTEAVIKGNSAVFLVADSGGASAVTRGVDGMIPARNDSNTQNTATLTEAHDLVQKTGFNMFASQGDQRRIMQATTMGVINRKIDADIRTQLALGTQNTGSAVEGDPDLLLKARTILLNGDVELDGKIWAAISPAMDAFLSQSPEYASADFIDIKPLTGEKGVKARVWGQMKIFVDSNLSGVGTSAEECYLWHEHAMGHALDRKDIDAKGGVDEEQNYSWFRASVFQGAKLLQNAGVVVINHDGSAYVSA